MSAEPIRHPRRTETPPPQHWRRWGGDAPVFHVPEPEPAAANADAQAAPKREPALSVPPATFAMPALMADPAGPFRVLIAEDDPSQAKFAEGVLAGTGMQTVIVDQPANVLEAMEAFKPDLVLMDLHMPGLDGLALTNRIRSREALMHTPIVFLTGDPDPERQYEVLAGGADDFLSKPIRPRHLVAAVLSRVQRARRLAQSRIKPPAVNPLTGLLERNDLIHLLGNALAPDARRGALLFVEIAGAERLRERLGYAAYEALMIDAGRHLQTLSDDASVARLNDFAFAVLPTNLQGADAGAFSRKLRDGMAQPSFGEGLEAVRLRSSIGVVMLDAGFADAGAALDAAERALRTARVAPTGIADYEPPQQEPQEQTQSATDQIREALAENRFELAYQPIVAVAGGDEPQYQTLLRLRDHDGHLRPAAQFLPALENTSLLAEIDHWVLERVLDTLQSRYNDQRPLRLFVPQSARSLARDDYADWLLGALEVHGLPGNALVIDLRLAEALIHTVSLQQFCQRMMRAGVQFCLSQYEQGAEAEALLAQLPLGYLRLSPRYANAQASSDLRDEMRGVIDRAHRQGLLVIGHQIEDPQAAANLWMSGIDFIQGNLVQRASGDLEFDFHSAVL